MKLILLLFAVVVLKSGTGEVQAAGGKPENANAASATAAEAKPVGAKSSDSSANSTPVGDATAGQARYLKNCVNCHGKKGKGLASFPSLIGRDAEYISTRLQKYRAREKVGPNSALMTSWAAKLSDEEIANISAYVSTAFK